MEQGIIFRKTDGLFNYIGWPTVARDENGKIYVVASGHRLGHVCPFGKNYMFISDDNAKSWLGPIIVNDSRFDDRDGGVLPLGDNKLLISWFINDVSQCTTRYNRITKYVKEDVVELWKTGAERWNNDNDKMIGSFIKISEDGGKSWSEPIKVPVNSPHGPTKLKNGKLLYLGTLFEGTQQGPITAAESEDDGKTWKKLYSLDNIKNNPDISSHEPYAIELDDGTILGIIRVHEDPDSHKFCMYKIFSYDEGKTWTTPEYLCPGSPPHILKHSSGALVLTYTLRYGTFGQCARLSYDGGKTWGDEIVLCDNAINWDSGYCSSVELDDGSIYTVYYQKAFDDKHCSLMYTKWELPTK